MMVTVLAKVILGVSDISVADMTLVSALMDLKLPIVSPLVSVGILG